MTCNLILCLPKTKVPTKAIPRTCTTCVVLSQDLRAGRPIIRHLLVQSLMALLNYPVSSLRGRK